MWDEARDFYVSRAAEFRSMVKQHRNHPSIAIWGLCNEMECFTSQNDVPGSNATVLAFKAVIDDLDRGAGASTRPAAFNNAGETNDLEVPGTRGRSDARQIEMDPTLAPNQTVHCRFQPTSMAIHKRVSF